MAGHASMGTKLPRILIPILTVAGIHANIVYGEGLYVLAVVAAAVAANGLLAAVDGVRGWKLWLFAAAVAGLVGVQAAVLNGIVGATRLVTLPPVLIHGWIAWTFLGSLRAGRVPLIQRFSRVERDPFPDELLEYTRRLTLLWGVYLALLTGLSAVLGLFADMAVWSWSVMIAMPSLSIAFFLAEHGYRAIVYRHLGGHSPLRTLRTIASPGVWIAP